MNYHEFLPIFFIGRDETIRLEPRYRTATVAPPHEHACRTRRHGNLEIEHVYRNFASSAVFMALFIMVSSHKMTR